jgi:hypothetical protein
MSVVCKGDRSQPQQNQCKSTHEASTVEKISAKFDKQNSSLEQVHVEACGAKLTIFHYAQGLRQFPVGARTTKGLQ